MTIVLEFVAFLSYKERKATARPVSIKEEKATPTPKRFHKEEKATPILTPATTISITHALQPKQ